MYRIGLALLLLTSVGCNDKKKTPGEEEGNSPYGFKSLTERFREASVPYILSDTLLMQNKDTSSINFPEFTVLADSLRQAIIGSGKVKYTPLARVKGKGGETYLVVKAAGSGKTAAFLMAYDKDGEFGSAMPFLVPDKDPGSGQTSSIDRNGAITRTMTRKIDGQAAEGRDVFQYDAKAGRFDLVMTDMLDDRNLEVINPIDTLPRKHKFAGDYIKDKNNFVSVRDSRYPNQLTVFISTSRNDGACKGEIKADVLLTSSTMAVYRQGGDPCVLEMRFSSNSVVLKEKEGCGSRRGMDCVFDGTYSRKKDPKPAARRE
ncbi:MAG TPA: hypothetical protein VGB46_12845 [Flavisolibacter sp.]|jgi:hypothetical protein